MLTPTYIDIHTHRKENEPPSGIIAHVNLHEHFDTMQPDRLYSVGWHPWYLPQGTETQEETLLHYARSSLVKAIGECGLDYLHNKEIERQQEAFRLQINIANRLGKPLVIHCVRAFPDVIKLLRQARVPVIFHGFNKKTELANELLQHGFYLSFGVSLLHKAGDHDHPLASLPGDRFFLETDHSGIPVSDVYKAAAKIRKTGEDVIILQLQKNYENVFI